MFQNQLQNQSIGEGSFFFWSLMCCLLLGLFVDVLLGLFVDVLLDWSEGRGCGCLRFESVSHFSFV